jgi:hypothetical protein
VFRWLFKRKGNVKNQEQDSSVVSRERRSRDRISEVEQKEELRRRRWDQQQRLQALEWQAEVEGRLHSES